MIISGSSLLLQTHYFIIFMAEWYSSVCVCVCVCTPHLLYPFTCWWTFRLLPYLGYCRINSAAMNTGVHISFQILVLSRYMPRSGCLDHMVTLFCFSRNRHVISIVAPIYTATISVGGFNFFPQPPQRLLLSEFWMMV